MAKKSKIKKMSRDPVTSRPNAEISQAVEDKFKLLLKIMSWIVGLSFITIIILPSFDFPYLDLIVKLIFYLGVFNLLLFAFLEMFGTGLKKLISKIL